MGPSLVGGQLELEVEEAVREKDGASAAVHLTPLTVSGTSKSYVASCGKTVLLLSSGWFNVQVNEAATLMVFNKIKVISGFLVPSHNTLQSCSKSWLC